MSGAPFLLAVMGPTASGKTPLAEALSDRFSAQLINADAFQVYRGFDIGTAKPEDRSRYLLLDIKSPQEAFGAGEFVQLAQGHLQTLWKEGLSAILVGGNGLYIRALMEEYETMAGAPDPELRTRFNDLLQTDGLEALVEQLREMDPDAAQKVDLKNPMRVQRALERAVGERQTVSVSLPPFHKVKVALSPPKDELDARILARTKEMLYNGWVDEVRSLRESRVDFDAPAMRAHGYRSIWRHIEGELTLSEAEAEVVRDVRRYSKRQRTWLRAEPNLVWLNGNGSSLEQVIAALDLA